MLSRSASTHTNTIVMARSSGVVDDGGLVGIFGMRTDFEQGVCRLSVAVAAALWMRMGMRVHICMFLYALVAV
jgi:hypothetical protein